MIFFAVAQAEPPDNKRGVYLVARRLYRDGRSAEVTWNSVTKKTLMVLRRDKRIVDLVPLKAPFDALAVLDSYIWPEPRFEKPAVRPFNQN